MEIADQNDILAHPAALVIFIALGIVLSFMAAFFKAAEDSVERRPKTPFLLLLGIHAAIFIPLCIVAVVAPWIF